MRRPAPPVPGRLAIVAGSGYLPVYVAESAVRAGENPFMIGILGESNADFSGYDHDRIGVGDMRKLQAILKGQGIGRVVLSGAIARRPEWRQVRTTFRHILRLPSVIRTLMAGGDDTVLKMVIKLIEASGARVIGAHEIAPDLLAHTGNYGRHGPGAEDRYDIERAARAAIALGELDVGQGAVSVGGRVVALEGVEGTDQMLDRVRSLREEGRISRRRKGVLVKLCKPQQDVRADLPSIGLSTVENAHEAGLAGIAIEAGRALVLDRESMIARADELGMFVCGIDRGLGDRWM